MDALDIIPLATAKDWLSTSDEVQLPRLIKSAINFVEVYTGYKLYQRPVTYTVGDCALEITDFPIADIEVKDSEGTAVTYKQRSDVYNIYITAAEGSIVTANAGYASLEAVDQPILVDAAYKMLTYLFQNRDIYPAALPLDTQIMVNKLRRNLV